MSLKAPNAGEELLLDIIGADLNTDSVLRLYVNDHTPSDSDTAANYTEATFPGYAAITLNAWGGSVPDGQGRARIEESLRTFTMSGSSPTNTVYGYYVTDSLGSLYWAERASASFPMDADGKTYSVLPRLTLKSEF